MNPLQQHERDTRLLHIAEAGQEILALTEGFTYEDFSHDRRTSLAIERLLITIGEALNRALIADPALSDRVSAARRITGFRHRLVHDYPEVDYEVVWTVLHDHLPRLLAEVRSLLPPSPAP
ncbi:MAG: DUF86 domain-containing protein [Acidobacteria bacterium]|nr:DUF86 domain-containing protein [Acidobacteriota bacterium]MBV9476069.1 DUF86 domain-containing protein [Acidobacteriota bacterium]